MGMWIELGIFIVVMVFALQQIREVRREQARRRQAREAQSQAPDTGGESSDS